MSVDIEEVSEYIYAAKKEFISLYNKNLKQNQGVNLFFKKILKSDEGSKELNKKLSEIYLNYNDSVYSLKFFNKIFIDKMNEFTNIKTYIEYFYNQKLLKKIKDYVLSDLSNNKTIQKDKESLDVLLKSGDFEFFFNNFCALKLNYVEYDIEEIISELKFNNPFEKISFSREIIENVLHSSSKYLAEEVDVFKSFFVNLMKKNLDLMNENALMELKNIKSSIQETLKDDSEYFAEEEKEYMELLDNRLNQEKEGVENKLVEINIKENIINSREKDLSELNEIKRIKSDRDN